MTRSSLRPGPRAGLEIAEAREWRIEVTSGGGVTMTSPGEPDTLIASPGQVARAVVLRGAQVPDAGVHPRGFEESLALLSDDAALLVVPLHLLAHGDVRDAAELRRVAGADDFAQSLGLALEPATDAEAALASRSAVTVDRGPVRSGLRRAASRHVALLVLSALGAIAAMALGGDIGPYIGLAASAVVLFVAFEQWRYRATFLQLVAGPPAAAGRTDVANGSTGELLQIGADDVVHVGAGTETWLAGPRRGGVVTCSVSGGSLRLVDRRGTDLLVLGATGWSSAGDRDTLQRACRAVGIDLDVARGAVEGGDAAEPRSTTRMSAAASGDVVTAGPFAALLISFFIAVTHAAPVDDLDPIRAVVVVVALAALALTGVAQLRQRQWSRRLTRTRG
ncbi:hypothetical protein IFT73_00420 [Aeromicrobium sp. CFBP 8757]|uniref:hypothetical protein n=1 Tax=Aeromicrobium sp. CFBP 8757 TaxID=2775288 RepID=UPI00177C0D70|nr:hypothetical protein [Aeromicrobium sp. CFBP 8757]MBD8605301.1 hypothetical protein [Aeromicrobium sp. CFBP 8757]